MPNEPSEGLPVLPRTIRTMIENTPLLPGEKRESFLQLFLELGTRRMAAPRPWRSGS